MKKLYIVVSKISDKKKTFADYLKGELIDFNDFSIKIDNDIQLKLSGNVLSENSVVYFRKVGDKNLSITNVIANILDSSGIEIIDRSLLKIGFWEDKLTNNYALTKAGIPVCPTIFSTKYHEVKEEFGPEFIAKEVNSQANTGIWMVRNEDEFSKLISSDETKKFIFQKFMQIDKEYRLLVIGDSVRTILVKDKRSYENFQVTNPSAETPEVYLDTKDVSDALKQMAVNAAKALDLQIAGVDLMVEKDTGKPYIIEVNRGPGITLDVNSSPELPALKKYFEEIL